MTAAAPELHVYEDGNALERQLEERYQDWRRHFNKCPRCNQGSWQQPDFQLRPCRVGRLRFSAWVRLAMAAAPSTSSRK